MTAAEKGAERYELIDRVAVGGMAEVYRAKAVGAHGFEKQLAIKRILPELAQDPEFEERFISEAKLAVALSHANIVQVLDFGRFTGSLFIAMEYVDGLDLAALLKWLGDRGERVPLAAAFEIALDLCRGLDFAHRQGVIHRDISPSNLLLSRAGEVKITDFGIAQAASKHSAQGDGWRRIMGKWRYMSPEQTRGDVLTTHSDLFSAGAVIFEILTGRKLFPGDEPDEIIANIDAMKIPSAHELRDEVPEPIDALLARALARDPRQRIENATQLVRELTAISYENNVVADALAVEELVGRVLAEAEESAKEQDAGGRGIDDLIRAQLGLAGDAKEETRRTAADSGERATALTGSVAIVNRSVDKDGITVIKLDEHTIAAGPAALRTGRQTGSHGAIIEERTSVGEIAEASRSPLWWLAVTAVGAIALLIAAWIAWPDNQAPTALPIVDNADATVPILAKLRVESSPDGATVFINDMPLSKPTPTITELRPDEPAHLRIQLEGYTSWEDPSVSIPAGQTLLVRQTLRKLNASLRVKSTPAGAEVFLDGALLGETPLAKESLAPGKRSLELRKPRFKIAKVDVVLKDGQVTEVSETLRSAVEYGRINLHIDDGWANVYLGSKRIGRAPAKGLKLPVGKHRLRLYNPASKKEQFLSVTVEMSKVRYYRTRL
jgi:serine/threonine-protein kinase